MTGTRRQPSTEDAKLEARIRAGRLCVSLRRPTAIAGALPRRAAVPALGTTTYFPDRRLRARVHVTVEETVEGVEPSVARAWWSDFREGHTDHGFVPGAERRIVEDDGSTTVMVDRVRWLGVPVFTERARAQVRGNTVQFSGENTLARFRGRYRFEPVFEPEGTKIVLEATIKPKGALSWIEGLTRPIAEWIVRWDLRKHAEDLSSGR